MKIVTTTLTLFCLAGAQATTSPESNVTITHAGSQPVTQGTPENFTGSVTVDSRFQRQSPARTAGGIVTFHAGARSAWHSHPLGQTLLVTSGSGWVQEWGHPAQRMTKGDTVWIPPNVKHWHGALNSEAMTHIAIAEFLEGKTVTWLEKVSDSEYPH
ncbi:MAG: hypothetical protein XXXJIFNMEKO3_01383 [Candidatus Erwinia impunctatus]|nr:hypothetical protein XXXJIFNMEKO_01383 [Culicoides impunctatus]